MRTQKMSMSISGPAITPAVSVMHDPIKNNTSEMPKPMEAADDGKDEKNIFGAAAATDSVAKLSPDNLIQALFKKLTGGGEDIAKPMPEGDGQKSADSGLPILGGSKTVVQSPDRDQIASAQSSIEALLRKLHGDKPQDSTNDKPVDPNASQLQMGTASPS
jgi:hypothetical protein